MRILFDSRQTQYKTPFGTLRTGECCVLQIRIPTEVGTSGVRLMLEDSEHAVCAELPFSFVSRGEDGYELWRLEFTRQETGLHFYWFRIDKRGGGSFRLFRQGRDTNMEAGEKWQLSVIPADFTVPDFAPGAVMYQIFPDRFARSGSCDLTYKLQPFWVHESPDELPEYRPDAHGEVRNNDFFGGNFAGIREKLPYLQELGVGVLYLNPIFMAWSNHRYDTADYRRPDPMLGTEEDFRTLCDEAHARGMRVILDGVFSHTGSNSVYFDAKHVFGHGAVSDPNSPYRRWYRFHRYPDDYEAWWGIRTLPCVEELDETYLHYIIEDEDSVIAHWLRLGADGFRLDVVDELPDEFVRRLRRRMRQIDPQSLLLGEVCYVSNGISYTARSLKTDSAADLTGSSENWTQELSWSDAGLAMDLRTDGEESWVGWYARSTGTQWALGAEDSAQSVLHSACGILKTLGYDVAVAPEDAENVTYSVLEIDGQTVAETAFTLDGIPYRWHVGTGDSEDPERLVDLSGSERVYPHTEETTIRWCRAELSDDPGNAGCKLIWIDIAPGLAYSLETDGTVPPEALQELAESLFVPAQGEEG